jgi:hypothetical protein
MTPGAWRRQPIRSHAPVLTSGDWGSSTECELAIWRVNGDALAGLYWRKERWYKVRVGV